MTWFDHLSRSWVHVSSSRMSLRRMDSNQTGKCSEHTPVTEPKVYSTIKPHPRTENYVDLGNAPNPIKDDKENIAGHADVFTSTSNINDPLKKSIYFLNNVSPKHRPHTNQKMSQHHYNKDYPETIYSYNDDDDLGLYYDDM